MGPRGRRFKSGRPDCDVRQWCSGNTIAFQAIFTGSNRLTVHADQPLYAPWFIDNDPTNGQGFESALTYKIAERLGFTADQVDWGYTSFNASYAPGPKDFDFYITEVSITETRKEAVDFSVSRDDPVRCPRAG